MIAFPHGLQHWIFISIQQATKEKKTYWFTCLTVLQKLIIIIANKLRLSCIVRCTLIAIMRSLIRVHNPWSSHHRIQSLIIHLRFKNLDVFVRWSADFRENSWDNKKKKQRERRPAIRHFVARLVTKKIVTRLLNKSSAYKV